MNFKTAMKTVLWDKKFDFRSRASRSEFWWYVAGIFGIAFVLALVEVAIWGLDAYPLGGPLIMIFQLLTLIPSLAVTARRLQDRGRSGWNQLWQITIIGIIPVFYWTLMPAKEKNNKWGTNPLEAELKEVSKNLPK